MPRGVYKRTDACRKILSLAKLGCRLSEKHKKKIGKSMLGNKNSYIRGYHFDKNGYKILHEEIGHIKEHRIVMEKYLDRPLKPSEIIHHKNGNPADNRIENLEITTHSEHRSLHARKYSIEWVKEQLSKGVKQIEMARIQKVSSSAINAFIKRHKISAVNELRRGR
jgi:hypothetical protein